MTSSSGGDRGLRLLVQLLRAAIQALLRGTAPSRRPASDGGPASDRGPAPAPHPAPGRRPTGPRPAPGAPPPRRPAPEGPPAGGPSGRAYAGDATDVPELAYAPFDDDQADPGEIVWAWVPYEEDHTRGKDRPVLVVGRRRGLLLALMLTSKDHDRDAADEARYGRHWVDIGSGAWDGRGRPSEVRVDRVLQLDPAAVRRQGCALDRERFDRVADGVRRARSGR